MAKLFFAVAFAFIAVASAGVLLSNGGAKDVLGNYYDYTTGQYSSSLTGKAILLFSVIIKFTLYYNV